ncbi:MAG: hypothetical protein KJT03_22415 [Verrucomicrobiae bacterium]|nr:hypothetical protein [Verrucomicrobiae bacterium]
MKSVNLLFRRTHLYLGMFLAPWVFIYAFSTFLLNHGPTFRQMRPGPDAWDPMWQREYSAPLPESQSELRGWAGKILEEEGIPKAAYGVQRNGNRVVINVPRFLRPVRITYTVEDQILNAERRPGSWLEAPLRLHFRHGYGQGDLKQWIWGFIVDLVCVSFLIWIVTGLYLWWKISHTRSWGSVALVAGFVYFFVLMFIS